MKDGLVKRVAFQALRFSGLLAIAERAAWGGVPILAYHGVTAQADPSGEFRNRRRLHVPAALFERHLDELCARWQPLALAELVQLLARGQPLPPRGVVLTFDDGYRNVLTQALPRLRARGVPATVFVLTGDDRRALWQDRLESAFEATSRSALTWQGRGLALDSALARERACGLVMRACDELEAAQREDLLARLIDTLGGEGAADDDRARLSWDDVRALRAAGIAIGSHADVHEPLTRRADDLTTALRASRATLARELGSDEPCALAYPYGARNPRVVGAARAAGFTCALSGRPRRARAGVELLDLGRFLVGADDDCLRLRLSLSGLRGLWQRDPWPARA